MKHTLSASTSYWWVLFLEGLFQLVLGSLLLVSTDITMLVLVEFLGIYWLIRGVIMIVLMFVGKYKDRMLLLFGGLLGIIAGIVVLRYPLFSTFLMLETLVVFIAIIGLVQGAISIVKGSLSGGFGDVLLGIILCIVGFLLLFNPFSAVLALPVAIGILWVIGGTVLLATSLYARK